VTAIPTTPVLKATVTAMSSGVTSTNEGLTIRLKGNGHVND
jgi:hypothetical protein